MTKGLKEEQKRDSETGEEVEGEEGREEQEVMYSGGMLSPCSLSCFFAAFSNSIICKSVHVK